MMKTKRQIALERKGRPKESSNAIRVRRRSTGRTRHGLLDMPLDIVFEILGYLHPRDLVALSHTSGALRETLCSRNTAFWKSARVAIDAPECALGFSERQWACFMFGSFTCGTCGSTDTPQIVFILRRRLCSVCTDESLVCTATFSRRFPDYDSSIMDMTPYTQLEKPYPRSSKYFSAPDLERIGKEWSLLQADIAARVKGAKTTADAYRKERVSERTRIMKYAINCEGWLLDERWDRRVSAIRERVIRLGYEEQDVPASMLIDPLFHAGETITDSLWALIRPELIARAQSNRSFRREKERAARRETRIELLKEMYDEYAQTLPPQYWVYLPDIRELIRAPPFNDIISADSGANVTRFSLLPAVAAFPTQTAILEWISVVKARLTSLLGSSSGVVDDPLELATSVFECDMPCCHRVIKRQAVISWEVIAAHAWSYLPTSTHVLLRLSSSHAGSRSAEMLVRLAGLDPLRATSAEMDTLDLRFACRTCLHAPPHRPLKRIVGYPWKPAIEHTLASGHSRWRKMSHVDTMRIKQAETYHAEDVDMWSCNHCAVYFKHRDTKARVVQHLDSVHGIASPTEPNDVFWDHKIDRRHLFPSDLASLEDLQP